MSDITVYDYGNNNARTLLNVGAVNGDDLSRIQSGTKTIDGHTWTISKSFTDKYISISFGASGFDYDISDMNADITLLGLRCSGLYQAILNLAIGSEFRYGFANDPEHDYPYLTMGRFIPVDPAPNETSYFLGSGADATYYHTAAGNYSDDFLGGVFPVVCVNGGDISSVLYGEGIIKAFHANMEQYSRIDINIYIHRDININSYTGEPGEKGFRPTGAYTTKDRPGNGGWGTTQKTDPDYPGNPITQPGLPNESVASAIRCGFLTVYKISEANLLSIGKNLYGETLLDIVKNISVNPLDFIVSLMIFPCAPAAVGSEQNIKLGGWLCAAAGGGILNALGTPAVGNPLTSQFRKIDFGTVQIPENWGSFLDYSQTEIELYLPFIGAVNIDVGECMGGTINVQYTIDFLTGMCVANVLCTKPDLILPSGKPLTYVHAQHAFQGNCAIQVPLSAVNYGTMIGSLINACTQAITNPVNGLIGMTADALGGGFRPNVSSKGNIVANSGFCSVLYPYVRITRPITAEPQSYQEVMGLPSYINTTLGQCSDLCICDDIDLKGVAGATEQELNKIRQMCKDGVYV